MGRKLQKLHSVGRDQGMMAAIGAVSRFVFRPRFWLARSAVIPLSRKFPAWDALSSRRVHGSKMYLNPFDEGISSSLHLHGTYEPLATALMKEIIRPGMTVIEIGANIGYYALLQARWVGATGRVIAIEPEPGNFGLLVRNVSVNGYTNVSTVNAAIARRSGNATLWLHNSFERHSLIEGSESNASIEVPAWSVDDLVRDEARVDVVKMDIEGYECEAIYGMVQTMKKHKPVFIVEIHPIEAGRRRIVQFLQFMSDNGYKSRYVSCRDRDYVDVAKPHDVEEITTGDLMVRILSEYGRSYHVVFVH